MPRTGFTRRELGALAAVFADDLWETLVAYGPSASGRYDTPLWGGVAVACRLAALAARDSTDRPGLGEWATVRTLYWDPAYAPPTSKWQVAIADERWTPIDGTAIAERGRGGQIVLRYCTVGTGHRAAGTHASGGLT